MFVLEGHLAYTGDMTNTYTVLFGTLEMRQAGRLGHLWKDNIKMGR
jgi:hypothetical protein